MANNRLYIEDPEDGEVFLIGKSMGAGWYVPGKWHDDPQSFILALNSWFNRREDSECGGLRDSTRLRLITENELTESHREPPV